MVSKITYELLKNSDVFKNIPILRLMSDGITLLTRRIRQMRLRIGRNRLMNCLRSREELIMTLKTSGSLSDLSMMLLRIWKMMIQAGRSRSV